MDLYKVTAAQYESLFTRIARDQILEAAGDYEGPQYWLERQTIGEHMKNRLRDQLEKNFASLWDLQLQVIDLPDKYEGSITQTQVQQQMVVTRQNEQKAASIRADTDVLKAEYGRKVRVVGAEAQANYTKLTKTTEAEVAKR